MGSKEEDDDLKLPSDTLACLNAFLLEQKRRELLENNDTQSTIKEDWQLSQFWYSDDTCKRLVAEAIAVLSEIPSGRITFPRIACISCPSLIQHFMQTQEFKDRRIGVFLFEYDLRFNPKFGEVFVHYDYAHPLNVPSHLHGTFDLILADPPFLSDECFVNVAQTIRLLAYEPNNCKLLISTGTVMEDLLNRLLKVRMTNFKPEHINNLANEFSTFANYEPLTL